MKKAVIFDLDGVIVDTARYHYLGWKKLADELGVPFDEPANEKLKGVSRRESLLRLLGHHPGEEKIKEYTDRKNEYYLEMVRQLQPSDILPGAREIVEALKKAGILVAVASSSKNARLVLGLLKLTEKFDAIIDGNQIVNGKPDPELFLKAAAALRIKPEDCLVVEDAEAGVEAALAAGMRCLGIGRAEALPRAQKVVSGLDQVRLRDLEIMLGGV